MTANVKFAKVKPDAIIPSKRDEDMGFDIYACFDEDYIVIHPHETRLIPTGIASACSSEYGFVLRERGSTGSKGIALRAGVIDSGYHGEWFVGLTNTTSKTMYISKLSDDKLAEAVSKVVDGDIINALFGSILKDSIKDSIVYPYSKAIAQALVVPVPKAKVEEISYEELKAIKSDRGMGALGSSNK